MARPPEDFIPLTPSKRSQPPLDEPPSKKPKFDEDRIEIILECLNYRIKKGFENIQGHINIFSKQMDVLNMRLDKTQACLKKLESDMRIEDEINQIAHFFYTKYNYNKGIVIDTLKSMRNEGCHRLYKTELCKNFVDCPFKSACRFAHSIEEQRDTKKCAWIDGYQYPDEVDPPRKLPTIPVPASIGDVPVVYYLPPNYE